MRADGPIYLVAELQVGDRDLLLEYAQQVQPLMARFGGRIVAADPAPITLEGDWQPDLLVIHRWDSRERFERFWAAEEYRPIRELRHKACRSRIVVTPALSGQVAEPPSERAAGA